MKMTRLGIWVTGLAVWTMAAGCADARPNSGMPTTVPSSMIQSVQTSDWANVQKLLAMQYASNGAKVEVDQAKVAEWIESYKDAQSKFHAERKKAFDNSVRDTKILLDGGYSDLAIDGLAGSYLLSDDKKEFVQEKWVKDLITVSIKAASDSYTQGDWLKARRIYINLSTIEPTESKWTHAIEDTNRRIRIVSRFSPASFAPALSKELDYRKKARTFLRAATQPSTTQPVAEAPDKNDSEEQIAQNLKTDWKQDLQGVRMDLLQEALLDSRSNYYKDITYGQMLKGGLNAMKILATTPGLEKAFPDLGNEEKKKQFLDVVDRQLEIVADRVNDRELVSGVLNVISAVNMQTLNLPEEVWVSEFSDGAYMTLDPFSTVIWPTDMEEFRTATQGEFSGVGVQIQELDGYIKVISPLEDSPALKAGIRAGDVITQINGKSAKGITTVQARRLITGPSGSKVDVTIRRPDDSVKDLTLTRQTIKVASIKGWAHRPGGGWDYMIDDDQKIAYLRLTNFTRESSKELDVAIDDVSAKGARAIILDLRANPGGLLTAAGEVSDKFLDSGTIVSTQSLRDATARSAIEARSTSDDVKLPMVVLINQYSASASEIVSGALRDLKRATIIGERSFGKGSVQQLFPLDRQQAYLKLTTNHYYLPNGKCIHREENASEWGVDPDMSEEVTPDMMRKVIDIRTDLDVLSDDASVQTKQAKGLHDLLDADFQLNTAIFMLRLQETGI